MWIMYLWELDGTIGHMLEVQKDRQIATGCVWS